MYLVYSWSLEMLSVVSIFFSLDKVFKKLWMQRFGVLNWSPISTLSDNIDFPTYTVTSQIKMLEPTKINSKWG